MLDSVYRPSLARLISELSKETQFIVTSHGRDILDYGDQFYGVKNINQVTKVCCSLGGEQFECPSLLHCDVC